MGVQDWGLSRMAAASGQRPTPGSSNARAHGWTRHCSMPNRVDPPQKNGTADKLHPSDPLDGPGLSRSQRLAGDLVGIATCREAYCRTDGRRRRSATNSATRFQNRPGSSTVYAYSGGYVSYANQPGGSNAHLFTLRRQALAHAVGAPRSGARLRRHHPRQR